MTDLKKTYSEDATPVAAISRKPDNDPVNRFLTWARDEARFAFQPVVDPSSGMTYGVEALLRGYEDLDFTTIGAFFDFCFRLDILREMEMALSGRAMHLFSQLPIAPTSHLFLNIDTRVPRSADHHAAEWAAATQNAGLDPARITLEISERRQVDNDSSAATTLTQSFRHHGFRIAVDDFGTGLSGLKLLYEQQPDYIKVDRFFISGIGQDRVKKLYLTQIVNLAQILGIRVIAEGIETELELLTCKEMGCDLVQGFFIAVPTADADALSPEYPVAKNLRRRSTDRRFIDQELIVPPSISSDAPVITIFDYFRAHKNLTFFPVLDAQEEPIGIIREEDLKDLTYSHYGKDLLRNNSFKRYLKDFIRPCPVADIHEDAERVLQKYSLSPTKDGVIVVENRRYVGFLTAASLLQVVNEKNLAVARDANPLTKLPGNHMVVEYVANQVGETGVPSAIAYFDFDNFKPFNDAYGFRQGDRAILLFAELMKKALVAEGAFLGHIGGDDFFAGWSGPSADNVRRSVADLRETFRHEVETFYDKEAREAGGIVAKDREGQTRKFPLLSVSAAVLHLRPGRAPVTPDELALQIAVLKKEAKQAADGIAQATLD